VQEIEHAVREHDRSAPGGAPARRVRRGPDLIGGQSASLARGWKVKVWLNSGSFTVSL